MAEFEGMDEAALRKLLEETETYEERAKIRGAIRELRKASGLETRRATGKSSYVRPGMGFNAPNITIPNSVTGNVLPSKLVPGASVKAPDKNTPTIGYLSSQTTQSKKTRHNSTDSAHTFGSQLPNKEETWWKRSRDSSVSTSTTGDSPEPHVPSDNRHSERVAELPGTPSPVTESSTSLQKHKTTDECSASPEVVREFSEQPDPELNTEPVSEQEFQPKDELTNPLVECSPEPVPDNIEEEQESGHTLESPPHASPLPASPPPDSPTPVSPTPDSPTEEQKMVDDEEGYDENYDDEEVEELKKLQDDDEPDIISANTGTKLDEQFRQVEPGLGEELDFRKKLRRAEEVKIDTKAAFPQSKTMGEQVDFRNVLRKTEGPEKKNFKTGSGAQIDFRSNLKNTKDIDMDENTSYDNVLVQEADDVVEQESEVISVVEENKEQDERKSSCEISTPTIESDVKTSDDLDSYEARREARRKAREEKRKKAAEEEPPMSYREKQKLEQSKRVQDNKKKWADMDGANGDSVEKPTFQKQKSTGTKQLLAWCQHKTRYYENVEVKDFSNSWADGLALCAVLHSFMPDVIPYDDLTTNNPRENFTIALEAAEAAGIGAFFDVEDIMIAKIPDPKSMMTFLATIYQHFK